MPEYLIHIGTKSTDLPDLSDPPVIVSRCTDTLEITDIPFGDGKQYDQRRFVSRHAAEFMLREYPGEYEVVSRETVIPLSSGGDCIEPGGRVLGLLALGAAAHKIKSRTNT